MKAAGYGVSSSNLPQTGNKEVESLGGEGSGHLGKVSDGSYGEGQVAREEPMLP